MEVVGFFAVKAETRQASNAWNAVSCQTLEIQPVLEREQSADSEACDFRGQGAKGDVRDIHIPTKLSHLAHDS